MTVTRLAGLFSLPAIAAVLMTPTTFGQADDQSQGENKQATTNPPIVERAIEEAQREAIGGGDPARSVSRESLDLGRLRPAKAALLREGSHLVETPGVMLRDPVTNWWHFVVEGDDPASPHYDLTMLPCMVLDEMQHLVESMADGETIVFEATGQVFVYRNRNYFLPTYAPRLLRLAPAPAPIEASDAPAPPDDAGAGTAADVERQLERAVQALASAGDARTGRAREQVSGSRGQAERLTPEGSFVMNRRGTVSRHPSGAWMLTFDADASGLADPPMVLLPGRQLERLERYMQGAPGRPSVLVSGRAYLYRGRNYLQPTLIRQASGSTPLSPGG